MISIFVSPERLTAPEHLRRGLIRAVIFIAAISAGCDMGSRDWSDDLSSDAGYTDSDMDAGGDTDTDTSDDYDSWQIEDAGDTWDDGTVVIEGPCGNDCQYVYDLSSSGWSVSGTTYFTMQPGGGVVRAYGTDSARFVYFLNQAMTAASYYRQRLVIDLNLDPVTLELVSGAAYQYNMYAGVETARNFSFAYDSAAKELTYSQEFNGRHWTRTLASDTAPLIMFNHREYPMETWGSHSSLFAYLIGKRYDWETGGAQELRIFSPEMERLDTLTVEKDVEDPQTLIVEFPVDSWEPLRWSYDTLISDGGNRKMSIKYEYDIPRKFEGLPEKFWEVHSQPAFEVPVNDVDASVEAIAPETPTGYTTESITFANAGATIAGDMDIPDAGGPSPVVVMMPGWDHRTRLGEVGAVDMYSQIGARLAAAGYLAVRFDARGCGDSTGELQSASVDDLAGDVETVVELLGGVPEADESRIFLFAMGHGAHVAAKAAKDLGAEIKGIIFAAPFAGSFREWGDDNYKHYLTNAGFLLIEGMTEADLDREVLDMVDLIDMLDQETYEAETWRGHTPAAWKTLLDSDLVADPSGLPPCLILVGLEDHLILPSMGKELFDAMGAQATLYELEGLTHALTKGTAMGLWPEHGAMEAVDEQAIANIVSWLDSQTGGAR